MTESKTRDRVRHIEGKTRDRVRHMYYLKDAELIILLLVQMFSSYILVGFVTEDTYTNINNNTYINKNKNTDIYTHTYNDVYSYTKNISVPLSTLSGCMLLFHIICFTLVKIFKRSNIRMYILLFLCILNSICIPISNQLSIGLCGEIERYILFLFCLTGYRFSLILCYIFLSITSTILSNIINLYDSSRLWLNPLSLFILSIQGILIHHCIYVFGHLMLKIKT